MEYERSLPGHRGIGFRDAGRRLAVTLAILASALVPALVHAQAAFDPTERGRELTQQFYDGEVAGVVAAFDEGMAAAAGGEEGLAEFRRQVEAQLGAETAVHDEQVTEAEGHYVYQRIASFEEVDDRIVVTWVLDPEGRVAGFSIQPEQPVEAAASPHLDYLTRTPLRLPFDGEWAVVWGGRTVDSNYHAASVDQRFAYDLLVLREGRTHQGSGAANEDYHCFGLPVLAPGPGVVAVAHDGVPDNTPGELDSPVPPGNHVVIDHGNGEHSFLAHLREGTVRVSEGDAVAPGDTLGSCGNSGRSSEPHLHYHLQTTPEFGQGEGLPAQFLDYVADDTPVERGEPVRGQRIRAAGG